jgi:hypothetical protein
MDVGLSSIGSLGIGSLILPYNLLSRCFKAAIHLGGSIRGTERCLTIAPSPIFSITRGINPENLGAGRVEKPGKIKRMY